MIYLYYSTGRIEMRISSAGSTLECIIDYHCLPSWRDILASILSLNDEWVSFCRKYTIYLVETLELVLGLSLILKSAPKPIVEVCAGRGKLAYWLRKYGVPVIATDDYSWGLKLPRKNVIRMSIDEALEKFKPRTVLGSWIPSNFELGLKILQFPTVKLFIDISSGVGSHSSWTSGLSLPRLRMLASDYGFRVYPLNDLAFFSFSQDSFVATGSSVVRSSQVLLFVKRGVKPLVYSTVG